MRWLIASVMALLVATPLAAQEPQERERQHVVRPGDTLWDLAGRYFQNPFQWRTIHQANTRIVANPHWIYPDQVLVIPGLREMVPDASVVFRPPAPPPRTVFYREPPVRADGPTVLAEPLSDRVPVKPAEFYRAEFLAAPAALPIIARVIRSLRELERAREMYQSAHPHDVLHLSYASDMAPAEGEQMIIAELGRRIRDVGPETRVIIPRAIVRVLELEPDGILVAIEEQFGAVRRDHVALPMEFYPDFLAPAAEPVPGEFDLEGRIIVFVEDSPMPNRMTRAFIDLGAGHGVQVGDIFEAFLPARAVGRDAERLPEESVAELRVVRVDDASATVVVDEIASPKLEPGIPVRRVRKMP